MLSDASTAWAVLALIVPAIAIGFSCLVWLGIRAGDREGDARAKVRLTWGARPDGWELQAVVTVNNPSRTAALVSARANPVSALALVVGAPHSVRVPFRERRRLMETTMLLGAAESGVPANWVLPLGIQSDATAVRVDIRLDQHQRARLLRYLIAVPAAPSGSTRSLGVRDPQDA